jgi:Flp pilus assembly protein TadG
MMLLKRLRRFGPAKKGSAAVEFAIIAPMMIFLLFGSVDLLDALNINKRVQNAGASIADVAARDTEISLSEIDNFWAALDVLMFPTDGEGVQMRISSVQVQSASSAVVVWSRGHGGYAARTANSTVNLPAAMMTSGTSIIMAETKYDYRTPLGFLMPGPVTLTHIAYRRSRLVDPIPCTWSGCS